MRDIDKFRGCLIGGAAGDALGYVIEFYRESEIFSMFGEDGITEYELINGEALISDDTQMTLFTANGLLYGTAHQQTDLTDSIYTMYQCWYRTQTERYSKDKRYPYSWLMNIPELFSLRAPGITCMNALRYKEKGTINDPINDSKGCGGVMRVAPIGLYFCDKTTSYEESDMLGAKATVLTHGHDLGYIPSAALVHIIRAVVERDITLKEAVNESIDAAEKMFSSSEYIEYFSDLMRKAVMLSETEDNDLYAIHQLGGGWVAEETLAIAVYCSLKYQDDFDMALRVSVNHNGDSDSTGAVTGNILGAYIGYKNIPQKYKDHLELHDIIIELADDLHTYCKLDDNDHITDEAWKRKYVEIN